jgi:hypothetical protein
MAQAALIHSFDPQGHVPPDHLLRLITSQVPSARVTPSSRA